MADSGSLVKLGVVAAVGYYAYTQGWLSALGIGAPVATTPATGTTPVTGNTATGTATTPVAPITGANTVAGIQAATILQVGDRTGLSVDDWGYYLNMVLAPLGKVAPDPMPIFTAAVPGFSRGQVLTAAQYWGVMAPALKTDLGLSGLGMYAYGGGW